MHELLGPVCISLFFFSDLLLRNLFISSGSLNKWVSREARRKRAFCANRSISDQFHVQVALTVARVQKVKLEALRSRAAKAQSQNQVISELTGQLSKLFVYVNSVDLGRRVEFTGRLSKRAKMVELLFHSTNEKGKFYGVLFSRIVKCV